MYLRKIARIATCAALAGEMWSSTAATARTLRVPTEQPTIQAAIVAAAPADTVLVADGTYTGNGNRDITFLGKAIVLRSQNGPAFTTIDCQANADDPHRGVLFGQGEGPSTVLDGFTIVNGYMSTAPSRPGAPKASRHPLSGGGITVQNTSTATIRNCRLLSCGSEYTGGGISIELVSTATLSHCTIQGCTAYFGGGVSIETASSATLVDCVVTGNRSAGGGGGISCWAEARLVGCVVSGNFSPRGGGFELLYPGRTQIERSIIWGNCAAGLTNEVFVDTLTTVSFSCSALDTLRLVTHHGTIQYLAGNVFRDPLLCDPRSCTQAPILGGDFRLKPGSPGLPENSPCGQIIGAPGRGCITPVTPSTWGRLKSRYR